MNYAICHLSVVPVRSSPTDRSEQVSQLLFGEMVECLESKGRSWMRVRCTWDDCMGWVKSRQLTALSAEAQQRYSHHFAFCLDLLQPLLSSEHSIPVPLGSRLPDFDGMKFSLGGETYFYSGQAVFPEHLRPEAARVIKLARRLLYAPYQWGGRSPFGVDAGGMAQLVFGMVGIPLARTPDVQVLQGENVDFIEQSAPGDLAFFENHLGNINHTGILLPDRRIIHAFEKVRIDRIDHFGIFNEEDQQYTHRLRVVKRVIKAVEAPGEMPEKAEVELENRQIKLFD